MEDTLYGAVTVMGLLAAFTVLVGVIYGVLRAVGWEP